MEPALKRGRRGFSNEEESLRRAIAIAILWKRESSEIVRMKLLLSHQWTVLVLLFYPFIGGEEKEMAPPDRTPPSDFIFYFFNKNYVSFFSPQRQNQQISLLASDKVYFLSESPVFFIYFYIYKKINSQSFQRDKCHFLGYDTCHFYIFFFIFK